MHLYIYDMICASIPRCANAGTDFCPAGVTCLFRGVVIVVVGRGNPRAV